VEWVPKVAKLSVKGWSERIGIILNPAMTNSPTQPPIPVFLQDGTPMLQLHDLHGLVNPLVELDVP
jgi:hypothetical protein